MRYADDIHKIMTKLYDSLLENYEAEENILVVIFFMKV